MRKRSRETESKIIAVAKKLFFESGYDNTTMDHIADLAHITKRTVYGYFPDKKTLFLSVITDSVGIPWVFKYEPDEIHTPEELYRALYIIAEGINNTYSNPEYAQLLRVIVSEVDDNPELNNLILQGVTNRALNTLIPLFELANKRNIVKIMNPTYRAKTFVGGLLIDFYLHGLVSQYPGKVKRYSKEELLEYVGTAMPVLVQNILRKP